MQRWQRPPGELRGPMEPVTTNTPEDPSGITAATCTARRVVLAAFVATALLAVLLTAERLAFLGDSAKAFAEVQRAGQLADQILLEDERLTMSAHLASATGEWRWAVRYEKHLPQIDIAIAAATAMAPPGAAERFDQATRVANDRLVELEREAFAHVQKGELARAQRLLNGEDYARHKAVLASGSDAFMAEVQQAADARRAALQRQSWWLLAAALFVAAAGFAWLWRHLGGHLDRAEAAFDAKQEEVRRLALHDPLTGLSNRRYLMMQLSGSLARARREGTQLAVLVLDLDGFKPINDRHGHAAGDAVLMAVAQRLNGHARRSEIVARLGGDEFVVVLDPCEAGEAAVRAAQRLVTSLAEPIALAQGEVAVAACAGVAFFPADGDDVETLIRRADLAMYRAKAAGRGEVRFFQESMDHEVREREALQQELAHAIEAGQVVPYFQPLVDLPSGRLTGFEVLARWLHPERGEVPPARFVPVAEDGGLIDALTDCVVRGALAAARGWDPALTIAVNIAPQQLRDEALVDRLVGLVRETGFAPTRLEIEITESALIGDLELARRIVQAIKQHGIRVALDDFGTGYSSLSHLSELPFDKIKIDRSFVRTMHERRESASIVNAIVGLGRSLAVPTCAEGIESLADERFLAGLGCELGQGYLYARPMPQHEAAAFAARRLARDGAEAPAAIRAACPS
jgi:diguanylate cyclase (GGDEF)-like protein